MITIIFTVCLMLYCAALVLWVLNIRSYIKALEMFNESNKKITSLLEAMKGILK
jgi:hypothetical protein